MDDHAGRVESPGRYRQSLRGSQFSGLLGGFDCVMDQFLRATGRRILTDLGTDRLNALARSHGATRFLSHYARISCAALAASLCMRNEFPGQLSESMRIYLP